LRSCCKFKIKIIKFWQTLSKNFTQYEKNCIKSQEKIKTAKELSVAEIIDFVLKNIEIFY